MLHFFHFYVYSLPNRSLFVVQCVTNCPFYLELKALFYSEVRRTIDDFVSSVVGRGIVVHAENGGSARLACGTIKPVESLYVEKVLQFVEGAGFSQ